MATERLFITVMLASVRQRLAGLPPNSPGYRGSVLNGGNVSYLKTSAEPNTDYFWRVDAEVRPSEVTRGDVWSFTTGDGDVTQQNGGSQWYSAAILIMMLAFQNLIMH